MYKQIEKIAEKYKGYFVKGEQSGFAFTSYDDRAMFLSDIRKRLL
jgi:predicted transcriptional regulator